MGNAASENDNVALLDVLKKIQQRKKDEDIDWDMVCCLGLVYKIFL